MYHRLINPPENNSLFLFGPRGTGKTTWTKQHFPQALYFDLLESGTYKDLLANPGRLEEYIPTNFHDYVIIDEVQRVPELLNGVHRLIESKKLKFILTGSSARKLRRGGHNLLAGRALTYRMYPLTAIEMGTDFDVKKAMITGMLPLAQISNHGEYLKSYIKTYLDQEILQEGLTRNLAAFSRFLEVASFSQGQILNVSNVAREAAIERTTVIGYFNILQDLLIGYMIPPFTKRAKRRLVSHPKFYYFDVGLYRAIRPMGPYDTPQEIGGISVETLVCQQLIAVNDLMKLNYKIHYYRTATGTEVDFIMYGERGIIAIEVKSNNTYRPEMIAGLKRFALDYPEAKLYLFYTGDRKLYIGNITVLPLTIALHNLSELLTPHSFPAKTD